MFTATDGWRGPRDEGGNGLNWLLTLPSAPQLPIARMPSFKPLHLLLGNAISDLV